MSERRRQRRRRRSRSRDRNERKASATDPAADAAPDAGGGPEDERQVREDHEHGGAPREREEAGKRDSYERPGEPEVDGEPLLETQLENRAEARLETPETPAEGLGEDPEDPEAFGRWLRRQRELRGVELKAIAESSKISQAYLRALEDGRFGLLPAEIFAKGFVDQYARFVGLDPEEAVNFYLVAKRHRDEEEKDALLEVAEPPPESSGVRWVVAALILAALFLGVVWVLSSVGTDAAGTDAVSTDAVGTDADDSGDAGVHAEATAGEETTERRSGEPSEAPPGDADAATLTSPPDASASSPTSGEEGVTARRPPSLAPLRVVVDFTDSCWVSAREDGGDTLQKLFTQGESLILEAERIVELKVGNHRSADVEVNGIPYDLAAAGRTGSLVRDVRIDLQTAERLRRATRDQGT